MSELAFHVQGAVGTGVNARGCGHSRQERVNGKECAEDINSSTVCDVLSKLLAGVLIAMHHVCTHLPLH